MKVKHSHGTSIVIGKTHEKSKVLTWINKAGCDVVIDESEGKEVCYIVVSKSPNTTQKERQLDFQHAKKLI